MRSLLLSAVLGLAALGLLLLAAPSTAQAHPPGGYASGYRSFYSPGLYSGYGSRYYGPSSFYSPSYYTPRSYGAYYGGYAPSYSYYSAPRYYGYSSYYGPSYYGGGYYGGRYYDPYCP